MLFRANTKYFEEWLGAIRRIKYRQENCIMDILVLAQEIIDGRRITRQDDLSVFLSCDLDKLCEGADKIREYYVGETVDLCSIINGRSGRCPEDCKYCAQSAHNHTGCEEYDFLSEEEILEACKKNEQEGVHRFSIVTSGRALSGEEFEKAIHAFERMHRECKIDLCASMGFLNEEQLHRLHEAGVSSYHHNIETSRRNFPNICTTHTYDQKIETLKKVKAEGMCACSGGIIGMGETWEDRLDMAVSLAELSIDSIPINALMPIKGTPLEDQKQLTEDEILRTISFFRYINPEANIRLAAGRALLTNDGEIAFRSGASATITGNMLTTASCATIRSDKEMLKALGRDAVPDYQKL
jgi:biotin synthase